MAFMNYNDPLLRGSNTPQAGMVDYNGIQYLVERGIRNPNQYLGQEGATQIDPNSGADDWMWRDNKTGQEHFLSDYVDQGAKLYASPSSPVMNRSGYEAGGWVAGMSGDHNYFDVAERADDQGTLGYLRSVSPDVRRQLFDAAGLLNTQGAVTPDQLAQLERVMYRVDPNSFSGGLNIESSDMGSNAQLFGQMSPGGVDPLYGGKTANKGGEYFRNPENLKFSPEFGLYNDGSAGFVGRPKQSALAQGMPFMMAAGALMGGAAGGLLGDPSSIAGAATADAVGTGAELGFSNMLTDSNIASGAGLASEAATGAGAMDIGGGLFNMPSLTGNRLLDRVIMQTGKGLLFPSPQAGMDGMQGGASTPDYVSGRYNNGWLAQQGVR